MRALIEKIRPTHRAQTIRNVLHTLSRLYEDQPKAMRLTNPAPTRPRGPPLHRRRPRPAQDALAAVRRSRTPRVPRIPGDGRDGAMAGYVRGGRVCRPAPWRDPIAPVGGRRLWQRPDPRPAERRRPGQGRRVAAGTALPCPRRRSPEMEGSMPPPPDTPSAPCFPCTGHHGTKRPATPTAVASSRLAALEDQQRPGFRSPET